MRRAALGAALGLWATGLVAAPPGAVPPERPQSLTEIRAAIAWYGAACLLNATSIDTIDGPLTQASLTAETGVSGEWIANMAATRAAEHQIAVEVLRRGGEPLRDPPEPFLTILRQAQSDCQDYVRMRRVLQVAIDRGALPDTRPPDAPGPLRPAIDPFPFDNERRIRLREVIFHVPTALSAGDYADDLLALLRAVSGRAAITLEDVANVPTRAAAGDLARDILLPDPTQFTDITAPEAAEIAARLIADGPDGPFTVYYARLLLAHGEVPEGIELHLFRTDDPPECRAIAGTNALRCQDESGP